jgi:hypothetical protein
MNSEKLMIYGGVAAFAIVAWLGVNSVLKASAREDARIDGINKARSIGALISQDDANFGTVFRDALMDCTAETSEAKLPNAIWEYYGQVVKSAVAKASDENYAPRNRELWFLEAQRAAALENPMPEALLAKLNAAEKPKVEAAMTDIDSKMVAIGDCLVKVAQN